MKKITFILFVLLFKFSFAQPPQPTIWLDFDDEIIPSIFTGVDNMDSDASTPNQLVTDGVRTDGKVLEVAHKGYFRLNNSAINTSDFTVAYWYKWLDPTKWWIGHISVTGNNNDYQRHIMTKQNGGGSGAELQNWGNNTGNIFKNNTWHHVALTYSGGNATVILDGAQVASGNAGFNPGNINAFALNFGIKLVSNGAGNPYSYNENKCPNSLFDNFMVFDQALSVSEVNDIMGLGAISVADLALSANKTTETISVNDSKQITYTLTNESTTVDVNDIEVNFYGAQLTCATGTQSAGTVDNSTWTVSVAANSSETVVVDVTPTESGIKTLTASISKPIEIYGETTIDDVEITAVSEIDLIPTESNSIVSVGNTQTITYSIRNNTTAAKNGVYVVFSYPDNFELNNPPTSALGGTAQSTWIVGSLPANGGEATTELEFTMSGNGSGDVTAEVYEGGSGGSGGTQVGSTSVSNFALYDAAAVPLSTWIMVAFFALISGVVIIRKRLF